MVWNQFDRLIKENSEKIKTKADLAPRSTEPNALTVCEDCKQEGKIIEQHRVGVTDKTGSVKSKTEEISLEREGRVTSNFLASSEILGLNEIYPFF